MCDLEGIGESSIFQLIRRSATLGRMCPTLTLNGEENTGDGMNETCETLSVRLFCLL